MYLNSTNGIKQAFVKLKNGTNKEMSDEENMNYWSAAENHNIPSLEMLFQTIQHVLKSKYTLRLIDTFTSITFT